MKFYFKFNTIKNDFLGNYFTFYGLAIRHLGVSIKNHQVI